MKELTVGEVFNVEGVTLGVVSKVDKPEQKAVVVCLDFPYFRLVNIEDFLLTSIRVADSSRNLVAQVTPQDQKDTSVNAWEQEIESLAEAVLDIVSDEYDDEELDMDDDDVKDLIKKEARVVCRGSDWVTDSNLNDKTIKYSITYLDVTSQEIMKYVPENNRHIWTAVRRAAALAHLISDVCEKVRDMVEENQDDYEDDDGDD